MPKPKKKKVSTSETSTSTQIDEPEPPLDFNPPSPPPKPPQRLRAPASPGMQTVKSAAYTARKASRIATKARIEFLKDKLTLTQFNHTIIDRLARIGRDWKKQGRPAHSTHLVIGGTKQSCSWRRSVCGASKATWSRVSSR